MLFDLINVKVVNTRPNIAWLIWNIHDTIDYLICVFSRGQKCFRNNVSPPELLRFFFTSVLDVPFQWYSRWKLTPFSNLLLRPRRGASVRAENRTATGHSKGIRPYCQSRRGPNHEGLTQYVRPFGVPPIAHLSALHSSL